MRTYSGGMRRRLDLGASLVGRPRLLLLDEPTTGLDPRTRQELWAAIRELVADGTDVLLTTQYLEEADQLARDVVIIDHGRVIAAGTPDELKSRAGRDVVEVRPHRDADIGEVARRPGRHRRRRAPRRRRHPPRRRAGRPGAGQLAEAVRLLDEHGVGVDDIGLRRPTLDEVFLTLTGAAHRRPARSQRSVDSPCRVAIARHSPTARRARAPASSPPPWRRRQRTVLQFFRTPQVLVMGTIQGALFLFMFRYVFGGAIGTGSELDYVDFLVPGFLVTTILWTGMSAAAGVAEDSAGGVYDRLRSLPVPRSAVMVGRSLADTALVGWGMLVTGSPRLPRRLPPAGQRRRRRRRLPADRRRRHAPSPGSSSSSGLVSGNAQAAQGLSMLVIPFSFVSSANVPVELDARVDAALRRQPAGVGDHQRRAQPDARRHRSRSASATPRATGSVLSLVWCAAIVAVFLPIATIRFGRRR